MPGTPQQVRQGDPETVPYQVSAVSIMRVGAVNTLLFPSADALATHQEYLTCTTK